MMNDPSISRAPGMIDFKSHAPAERSRSRHWLARSQNFFVELIEASQADAHVAIASAHETMVLVFGAPAVVACGGTTVTAAPRSVCILPAGAASIGLAAGASCVVLTSQRANLADTPAINQADYLTHDPRIVSATPAYRRRVDPDAMVLVDIDRVAAPTDNPRLKMLQSATMSINWVEYEGARDRRMLSPHSHADFEQGSLALAGGFVHHVRQPWGRNAELWREDAHITVGSPSLIVVPVNLIHTSEGIGRGNHLLIDVFSPPRSDFIAKGWVAKAADYDKS